MGSSSWWTFHFCAAFIIFFTLFIIPSTWFISTAAVFLLEFVLPGSLGFFVLLIVLVTQCEDNDAIFFPYLAIYAFYLKRHYFVDKSIWEFLTYVDWSYVALGFGIYFAVGFIWSFAKLKMYVKRDSIKQKIKKMYKEESQKTPELFVNSIKFEIYNWILYWPLSVVYTLTHDLFKDVLNYFYTKLGHVYRSIVYHEIQKFINTR